MSLLDRILGRSKKRPVTSAKDLSESFDQEFGERAQFFTILHSKPYPNDQQKNELAIQLLRMLLAESHGFPIVMYGMLCRKPKGSIYEVRGYILKAKNHPLMPD